MYAKVFSFQRGQLLACCNKELLGKILEDENIHFEVKENFYKGKIINKDEFKKLLSESDNINLVGDKPVEIALSEGYLNKDNIMNISNIPHVQIFKL